MPEQNEWHSDSGDHRWHPEYVRRDASATVPDLRRQLGILSQRVTHLEALMHKFINRDDQGGNNADSD